MDAGSQSDPSNIVNKFFQTANADNKLGFFDYFSKTKRTQNQINKFEEFSRLAQSYIKNPDNPDPEGVKSAYEQMVSKKWKEFSQSSSPEYGLYSKTIATTTPDAKTSLKNFKTKVEANIKGLQSTLRHQNLENLSPEKLQAKIKAINYHVVDQWYKEFGTPFSNSKAASDFNKARKEFQDRVRNEILEFKKLGADLPKDVVRSKIVDEGNVIELNRKISNESGVGSSNQASSNSVVTIVMSEKPISVAPKKATVVPDVEKKTLTSEEKSVASVNASWFLQLEADQDACQAVVYRLYDKSLTNEGLSKEDWLVLARGLDLMLDNNPNDKDLKGKAEEIFVRYYLHEGKKNEIPQEYTNLNAHLRSDQEFGKKLAFINQYVGKTNEGDPNCVALKNNLYALFPSSSLENCTFELKSISNDTKTPNDIYALAQGLRSKPVDVKNISLVLGYAMQLKAIENEVDKKLMGQLNSLGNDFFRGVKDEIDQKLLGNLEPEKQEIFTDFLQLYRLFEASDFLTRKSLAGHATWGYLPGIKPQPLAGNDRKNKFEVKTFKTGLIQAKTVILHENPEKTENVSF